ncbi:hypothetical protein [Paractinoplanes maris]|uniref:hypothetical protein n=1 Tax=Paractinoplanes maris TaxID=1734446 RepID=UPI0020221D19|nr:hypothetical protein [Actinoplanes maris]
MVTKATLHHGIQRAGGKASQPPSNGPPRLPQSVMVRRAWGNAAMLGITLGAWLGLLTGAVVGLFVISVPTLLAMVSGLLIGGAAGGILGLVTHAATDARSRAGRNGGVPSRRPRERHSAVTLRSAGHLRPLEVETEPLPGSAVSYTLTTAEGKRVGVVAHLNGRRDVISYDRDDVDRVAHNMVLTETEAQAVAQMLGLPVFSARTRTAKKNLDVADPSPAPVLISA